MEENNSFRSNSYELSEFNKSCSSETNEMKNTKKINHHYLTRRKYNTLLSKHSNSLSINSKNYENEKFCFNCYTEGELYGCTKCTRSYHMNCLDVEDKPHENINEWICPICKKKAFLKSKQFQEKKKKINKKNKNKNKKKKNKKIKKNKIKVDRYLNQIKVGENYQVPFLTSFFLNEYPGNYNYNEIQRSELIYSPYILQSKKEQYKNEGKLDIAIKNDLELGGFINELAKNWKGKLGLPPFTSEYALQLLHKTDYNAVNALKLIKSSNFNFLEVCDPPIRKYENKWKPSDKRGKISDSPHPSAEYIRNYLERIKIAKLNLKRTQNSNNSNQNSNTTNELQRTICTRSYSKRIYSGL